MVEHCEHVLEKDFSFDKSTHALLHERRLSGKHDFNSTLLQTPPLLLFRPRLKPDCGPTVQGTHKQNAISILQHHTDYTIDTRILRYPSSYRDILYVLILNDLRLFSDPFLFILFIVFSFIFAYFWYPLNATGYDVIQNLFYLREYYFVLVIKRFDDFRLV